MRNVYYFGGLFCAIGAAVSIGCEFYGSATYWVLSAFGIWMNGIADRINKKP